MNVRVALNGDKLLFVRVIDQIPKLIVGAASIHLHLLMLVYYASLLPHSTLRYEGTETVSDVLCEQAASFEVPSSYHL